MSAVLLILLVETEMWSLPLIGTNAMSQFKIFENGISLLSTSHFNFRRILVSINYSFKIGEIIVT